MSVSSSGESAFRAGDIDMNISGVTADSWKVAGNGQVSRSTG
jgi:hypothetical protein